MIYFTVELDHTATNKTNKINTKDIFFHADRRFLSNPLTCAGQSGGVLNGPVEAFITVTHGGRLVMAGAVQRTLGAFSVPGERLEGSRPTGWRQSEAQEREGGGGTQC